MSAAVQALLATLGTQHRGYLGDGAYCGASDPWEVIIAAERDGRVHWVSLDRDAVDRLVVFMASLAPPPPAPEPSDD